MPSSSVTALLASLLLVATVRAAWRPVGKTRVVRLQQGVVVGTVFESDLPGLGPVEVFRGIPYAQAERFMPPSSPARFDYLEADRNGPVCPQALVDVDSGMKMGPGRSGGGRLAYLKRLIPFLKDQSEDCLNLNIYVPSQEQRMDGDVAKDEAPSEKSPSSVGRDTPDEKAEPHKPEGEQPRSKQPEGTRPRVASRPRPKGGKVRTKQPSIPPWDGQPTWKRCQRSAYINGLGGNLNVIVFIHGESFSWNSGNPYDGSTLASYGNVIFVTLNYRLGVLGFLNTRNNRTTSNFGLLDQIAALRWLKDNIAAFGGDADSITLMGHHTGAIAVNYLMLSPVSQADNGLFQRAILMSGTALSGWAQSKSPEKISRSVAEQTRCPVDSLLSCLRERSLEDILEVRDLPEDPAPSVDGIVVKVQPKELMSHNNDLFTRYDLLCGVTESESYHILDNFALKHGLFPGDIKELLSKFFKDNFENWEQAQEKAMKVYGLDRPQLGAIEGRDNTLTLLSDARVVAPMVQTAVFHSTPGRGEIRTFFYVFSHRSKHGDHPLASMSVQGEDLAYVLGVPLEVGSHHFHEEYSLEEKHLSETIMSLWVNFAKTGNTNKPQRENYLTKGHSDWVLEDVAWPAFEPNNQHFYQIQIPPRIGTKYRDNLMHFWNYFLPTWKPLHLPHVPPNKYITSTKNDPVFDSCLGYDELPRKPPYSNPDWSIFPPWRATRKPVYGILVTPRPRIPPMDDSPPTPTDPDEESLPIETASSLTLNIIIFVGVLFLIINLISFAYIWYQKKKLRQERMMARYRTGSFPSIPDVKYDKKEEKCEIKSILKSNERLFDPLKAKGSSLGKWAGLYSGGSASTVTMDPHTKVSQWMKTDKSSPGSKAKSSDTIISAATTSRAAKSLKKPVIRKVSVAIDATPSARSESVLKQIPIELTKSLDFGKKRLGKGGIKPALQRSEAIDSDEEETLPNHFHSNSDPVDLPSRDVKSEKNLKTFEPLRKDYVDDGEGSLSADETLDNFKRRNYPKVLPDFPTSPSLSSCSDYSHKRMSLPIPTPVIDPKRMPPPPPTRATTATISRSHRTNLPSYMTSSTSLHATSDKEDQKSVSSGKTSKKVADNKRKDDDKRKRIEKRPEPRVIIKPTLTDPNQKKINSKIPRVTHKEECEPSTEQRNVIRELKSNLKSNPILKKSSTDMSGNNTSGTSGSSSVSSISTVKKAPKE